MATPDSTRPQALPENPLEACRYSTNCVRDSRAFSVDAGRLFAAAERATRALSGFVIGNAQEVEARPADRMLEARFRVLGFSDDLSLVVQPHAEGAVLHVRSASRLGRGDLGVNRRRVRALFDALIAELSAG